MGLREIAAADADTIVNDAVDGFGWLIQITNPAGTKEDFTGFGNDIHAIVDPETGTQFSARVVTVALRLKDIYAKGFVLPVGITDQKQKPWIVEFKDINDKDYTYKVIESLPDRANGGIVLVLESYKNAA